MRDAGLSIREDPMGNIYGRMARQQQHRYICADSISGLIMAPGVGCLPEAVDLRCAQDTILHL